MARDTQKGRSKIPEAFELLFKSKGFTSVEALSTATGNSPSTLRKIYDREPRRLQSDALSRVASRLDVSMDDLAKIMELTDSHIIDAEFEIVEGGKIQYLNDAGGEALIPGRKPLHVEHRVQAGMWVEEDDFTQDRLSGPAVYADPNHPRPQWLELVSGDSVDQIAPEGSYVHVVDWAAIDREPREGELVIVKRTRLEGLLAERSVKQVRRTKGQIELWPASNNPRWNAPLILDGAEDGVTVQIAGLVIWVHRPLPG